MDILLFISLAFVYVMTIIFAITAIVAPIYILVELIIFIFNRFKRDNMASENKKKKAKNSYLHNGADKLDDKIKRIMYFTKRQRNKNNKISQDY